MADAEPTLAAVLQSWMRRQRLRPSQLADAAAVTRAHIWLILKSRIARPTPETLRRLALALATDPYDKSVDPAARDAALAELAHAAGYDDLAVVTGSTAFRSELERLGSNPQSADFWQSLIAEHPSPSPTLQQLLRALLQVYGQRGGEDVQALADVLGLADDDPAWDDAALLALAHFLRNGTAHRRA